MKALNPDIQLINIDIQCVYKHMLNGRDGELSRHLVVLIAELYIKSKGLR